MEESNKIIEALSKVGIAIDDVYDLVESNKPYPEAIPVLSQLLKEGISNIGDREGVIRALAIPEAKGEIGSILIDEYYKIPSDNMLLRWAIGNTMEVVISENDVDAVIKIVADKSNGMSRQMFALALGNVPSEKSEDALIQALDDDEITPHALEALGRLKSIKARNRISELTKHSNSLVKKEAKKALKKIG